MNISITNSLDLHPTANTKLASERNPGMDNKINDILETTFRIEENGGQDKVLALEEAVRQRVKPKMLLNIPGNANGAINEITRQFWDTKPEFNFIMSMFTGQLINLVQGGLVKKIFCSNLSTTYPTPRPSRMIQAAYRDKRIDIENWSLNTIQQRLMAGAMGVCFMPTKSLVGTSMEEENKDSFKVIDDPFGSGKKLGLVKAINPDLSIIHGWAADRYGNTILSPLYEGCLWGPRASKNVLVTVEKLVSTDFIRKHAPLVKIPGYMVGSVSVVPFGAHPQGMLNQALEAFETYGEDYEFLDSRQKAFKSVEDHNVWINEWVLSCPTHRDYLNKLGYKRLMGLKGMTHKDAWKYHLETIKPEISTSETFNETEIMTVVASRLIRQRVLEKDFKIVQVGIGVAALAGCLAYYQLRKENINVDVIWGSGQFGYAPRPGDPFLTSAINMQNCTMLTDITEMYGVIIGGEYNRCLSIIGAGQTDKHGNVNSTKLDKDSFLVGSGGSADATNAQEIMVVTKQSKARFLETIPYVSSIGAKTKKMVTNLGVFEKPGNDEEFTLTQYHPNSKYTTPEEHIRTLKEKCGWALKVSQNIKATAPPTPSELITLRLLDPKRYFLK